MVLRMKKHSSGYQADLFFNLAAAKEGAEADQAVPMETSAPKEGEQQPASGAKPETAPAAVSGQVFDLFKVHYGCRLVANEFIVKESIDGCLSLFLPFYFYLDKNGGRSSLCFAL